MSSMNNTEVEEQKGPEPAVRQQATQLLQDLIRNAVIVKQDERSALSAKLQKYEDVAAPVINSFNQYLAGLKEMINDTRMILDNGDSISFSGTTILNPTMIEITQKSDPMYPNYCRLNDRTYKGEISAVATWDRQDGSPSTSIVINLGSTPIMLRSEACNLRSLDREGLLAVRECPNDPFSYFVVSGAEKIIVMQERAATNKLMTYQDPDDQIATEIKCVASDGRKVKVGVRLMKKEDDDISETKRTKIIKNVIKLNIPYFDEAEINICAVFEVMGLQYEANPEIFMDENNIQAYILDWVDAEDRPTVAAYLDQTIEAYVNIRGNAIGYIATKLKLRDRGISEGNIRSEVINRINNELFVNMLGDPLDKRVEMMALLAARFITVVTGVRGRRINPVETDGVRDLAVLIKKGLDDRDDYGNKIVDTAGSLCGFLASQAWKKQVNDVLSDLNGLLSQRNLLTELASSMPKHYVIKDVMTKAIRSGDWGMPNKVQHTGISRTLQRAAVVGAIADVRSVTAPIPRESKSFLPRSVHLTYWGLICPTSTREGEDCGLAKSLAQGANVSIRRPYELIDDFVAPYISPQRVLYEEGSTGIELPSDQQRTTPLLSNGRFVGWCNLDELRTNFIDARRNGVEDARAIPQDVSINHDLDGILQIHSGEGRLIRPVLVVNYETQKLVIDELGLWDADWYTLLVSGAVEYLDSAEQGDALIAINPDDLGVPVMGPDPYAESEPSYLEQRDPNVTHVPYYTHCELDPALLFSYEANVAPFPSNNPGTRITYESGMAKHAVGINSAAYRGIPANTEDPAVPGRFESAKLIAYPQRPLVTTDVYDRTAGGSVLTGIREIEAIRDLNPLVTDEEIEAIRRRLQTATSADLFGATGQNAIVAILSSNPGSWNEEDSMMVNKRFIDNGGFMTTTYKADSYEIENPNIEKRGIPPNVSEEDQRFYSAIDPKTGIARPGSVLRPGMAILAKYTEENGTVRNTSIFLKEADSLTPDEILTSQTPMETIDASGKSKPATGSEKRRVRSVLSTSISNEPIMDEFLVGQNGSGKTFIKWKIRITRRPQVGDKFASRFSQKGVVGMVMYPEDMPWTMEGIVPDIIMNPHAYPSRMTIGQLIESLTGKAGALLGTKINGTAFRDVDHATLKKILNLFGYSHTGDEVLYDGATGIPLKAMVFQGPVFYQVLKHMVEDKKHGRARGDVHHLYRQPPEGRGRGGGLRVGEMERLPKKQGLRQSEPKLRLVRGYAGDIFKFRGQLVAACAA